MTNVARALSLTAYYVRKARVTDVVIVLSLTAELSLLL